VTDSLDRVDVLLLSALVIAFILVGLLTLDDYGLAFDETWHFLAGERYLRFRTTFDRSLMDFSRPHPTHNHAQGHPGYDLPDGEPRPAVVNSLSANTHKENVTRACDNANPCPTDSLQR
jgi:hypothetical protein